MGSFERKISTPPAPSLDERLASLEDEASRLRAELAELQEDIRWLAGDEAEDGDAGFLSRGLLARGWVRASLLLAAAGVMALVSVPYLLHVVDPSSGRTVDTIPAPSIQTAAPGAPTGRSDTPAPREYIPEPTIVRSAESPEPAPALATEERPRPPARLRAARERRPPAPHAAPEPSPALPPVRAESP